MAVNMDRWDTMSVTCIKTINGLKEGSNYRVKGSGNLEHNLDPAVGGKKGCGLCIEQEIYENWKSSKHSDKFKWHYFTIKELEDHFINDEEAFQIHLKKERRDLALENILYGNRGFIQNSSTERT